MWIVGEGVRLVGVQWHAKLFFFDADDGVLRFISHAPLMLPQLTPEIRFLWLLASDHGNHLTDVLALVIQELRQVCQLTVVDGLEEVELGVCSICLLVP